MKCTPFRGFLLVLGIFSLGFQLVGIFVPAWYRMSMEITSDDGMSTVNSVNIKMDIGLWMVSYCADQNDGSGENCVTASMKDIRSQVSGSDSPVNFESLLVIKVMLILGAILCCLGGCFMALYLRQLDSDNQAKCKGIGGAIFWGLGAIVVTAAVAIHVNQYMTIQRGLELMRAMQISLMNMEVFFPWAVYFTGIGAFLAIVTGLALAVRMCKSSREPYDGYTAQYKA